MPPHTSPRVLAALLSLLYACSAGAQSADERIDKLTKEVEELKALVHQLQQQIAAPGSAPPPAANTAPAANTPPAAGGAVPATVAASVPATVPDSNPLESFTVNALLDGYYEYNINAPVGRENLLRAYDVSSNSFSLNQADVMIESAVDPAAGKRYGLRLDLQFGQATSTLQGNSANELRPDVYRNVFQAYGSYVFPVADGLTFDFGKWASSLGIEGNYTKDQLNYSRSFWFDYLPFYHMGLRSKLAINDMLAVNLWITNGTNQTEAFNNYKDQLFGIVITPVKDLSITLNYYRGQEHPDVVYVQTPIVGGQSLPGFQGIYIQPIANAPDGKLNIVDSYVSWQATQALVLALEADYVQERLYSRSSPQRAEGGALYAGYQLSPRFSVAGRAEYLADTGGLFSGVPQYLTEETLTLDYRAAAGFLLRGELRRDHSSQRYFLGHTLGVFENAQPTVGLGVVWWLGRKQGAW